MQINKEAVNLALFLQSHYSVYLSKAPIEPELIRSVIRVCSYVLSTRPNYTDHYFKSNLRISGTDLYTEIVELEKQLREGVSPQFNLDLALRSLYALFKDLSDLSDDDFTQLSELIRPVWERCIEDIICASYY